MKFSKDNTRARFGTYIGQLPEGTLRLHTLVGRDGDIHVYGPYLHSKPSRENALKYSRNFRNRHKSSVYAKSKELSLRVRMEVLTHYSGNPPHCQCCDESVFDFLCMDHVNNNGNAHRREIGTNRMYYWIRRHGYPDGFQVLCYNCNMGKAHNSAGVCPHKALEQRAPPAGGHVSDSEVR